MSDEAPIINHEEALQLANLNQKESNLARCYLDLITHLKIIGSDAVRESRERLLLGMPHFRYAFEMGKEGGAKAEFAVISTKPGADGGVVVCTFDPTDFITDLATVLGETEKQKEDGRMEAAAASIVHKFTPH